jgi:hypothetical protein
MLPINFRNPCTKFHVIIQYRAILLLLNRQFYSTIVPLGRLCRRSTGHNLPPCWLQDVIMTFFLIHVISNLLQFSKDVKKTPNTVDSENFIFRNSQIV